MIRKINNNVALAVDGAGKELVVFGRGIGFPAMPYELTDLSRIQRVFRDVRSGCAQSPGRSWPRSPKRSWRWRRRSSAARSTPICR